MSIMYDSDNPDSIPNGVAAAGYVNGYAGPAWLARGFPRFPNARRITVFPTDEGDTCDVEWLDLTPEQAPPWVKGRLAAGVLQPWVYCNRSNRPAVEAALAAAGLTGAQVALWVATLDGTQTVPAGPYPVAAVQYANANASGGHYDLSLVNQTFGPGGGTIGGILSASLKYTLVRLSNSAFAGADHIPDDAAIVALGDTIKDDFSNVDTVLRAIQADAGSKPWQQIVTDLKAGKYLTSAPPPPPPAAFIPHTHTTDKGVA
jgi:hypothetical protein